MSDDRELRDALEKSQARVKLLERLVAEESEDRQALAHEMAALQEALADAERRLLSPPGEKRELVRLNAQVHAQQLQFTNLMTERDKLLQRVAELEKK